MRTCALVQCDGRRETHLGGQGAGGVAEQRDPADGEPRERAHQLRGLDDVDVRGGIPESPFS